MCFGAAFVVGNQVCVGFQVQRYKHSTFELLPGCLNATCTFPGYRYWLSRSIAPLNEAHARPFYLNKVRHEGRYSMKERDAAPMAA